MKRIFESLVLLCSLAAAQVNAQGAIHDSYGPTIQWRQPSGFEVTPIHIGLLPNGNLFFVNEYNFFENPGKDIASPGFEAEFMFLMQPTPADSSPPASVLIQPLANPPSLPRVLDARTNTLELKSLTCSGHALMADGKLFFAGGPDAFVDLKLYNSGNLPDSLTIEGIAESVTYDPFSSVWIENPNTVVPGPSTHEPLRWYPTVTRLADSRMLVTGGYEKVYPHLAYNPSVEVFDPRSNSWSPVSDTRDTPGGIENPDYTHVFQYPADGRVMMLGGSAEPLFLDLNAQDKWRHTNNYRPGAKEYIDRAAPEKVFPNFSSSSALLPLRLPEGNWGYANGSVINVGGDPHSRLGGQIDVYDPGADAWGPSISMHGPRHHASAVVLPDGRILILAGWNDDASPIKQTGYAEYVDPRNNFALSQGSAYMPETRGYHTLTVLLPDGRVLVGGGNVDGNDATEWTDFRYYYPDYMFKTRPEIVSAQDTIYIGGYSSLIVPHGTAIGEAALVGLGSMTHSFDMNQRHVQLRVFGPVFTRCLDDPNACQDTYVIQAPTAAESAPPGHYMLFILDANRVPSSGKILKLNPANGAAQCFVSNCARRRL